MPESSADRRSRWRQHWIESVFEFASSTVQEKAWLRGEGPWVTSYVECMCGYFDDLLGQRDYACALEQDLISEREFELIKEFHDLATSYRPPNDVEAEKVVVADPAWQTVVRSAQVAWHKLKAELSPGEELDFVTSLEQQWGTPGGPS